MASYKEINYEGYGPSRYRHLCRNGYRQQYAYCCNIRSYFTKHGGSLGNQGCLQFFWPHICIYRCSKEGVERELELIGLRVVTNSDKTKTATSSSMAISNRTHKSKSIWKTMVSKLIRQSLSAFRTTIRHSPMRKKSPFRNSLTRLRKTKTFRMYSPIWQSKAQTTWKFCVNTLHWHHYKSSNLLLLCSLSDGMPKSTSFQRKDIDNLFMNHHILHSLAIARLISFKLHGTQIMDVVRRRFPA